MSKNSYESPLCSRYASPEMQYLFSPDKKFSTWRRLWVALARAEHNLGLPITAEQVAELEAQVKAGQTISLTDLADAVHREKKKSVVAQLKNQPAQERKTTAPKKSAEKER